MNRWVGLLALVCTVPPSITAQDTTAVAPAPAVTITLEEALAQARANNPAYRQTLNDAGPARWAVRNAYASFLPSVNASSDFGYTSSGDANFGLGFVRPTSAFVTSGYSLGLNWELSGRTLSGPGQQKALRRATDEDISGAEVALRADITTQYLTALQAAAQVDVARQQVQRNEEFLTLARARHRVGQATLLDVRQAEVARSTSEVALLRAEQTLSEAKLELLRRMGVPPPVAVGRIALPDSFAVTPPQYQLAELLGVAEEQNPVLRSLRARRDAAWWSVRAARSDFLPRLSFQAAWSGFTQQFTNDDLLLNEALTSARSQAASCQFDNQVKTALGLGGELDCFTQAGLDPTGTALLDPVARQIRNQNDVFPFDYTSQPFRANLTISLPIFTGFGRSLRLSQARADEDDARESVRARRLQVRAEVEGRYLAVQTAYRAIAVQDQARVAARDQLRLAQERYRLGAGTSLEVTDAQTAVQSAEGDYVNAVYDYHKAVAALEAAVGRSLR